VLIEVKAVLGVLANHAIQLLRWLTAEAYVVLRQEAVFHEVLATQVAQALAIHAYVLDLSFIEALPTMTDIHQCIVPNVNGAINIESIEMRTAHIAHGSGALHQR